MKVSQFFKCQKCYVNKKVYRLQDLESFNLLNSIWYRTQFDSSTKEKKALRPTLRYDLRIVSRIRTIQSANVQ